MRALGTVYPVDRWKSDPSLTQHDFFNMIHSAEVLHYTGATDDIPKLSEEQSDLLQKVKNKALVHAESFRVQARRRL